MITGVVIGTYDKAIGLYKRQVIWKYVPAKCYELYQISVSDCSD